MKTPTNRPTPKERLFHKINEEQRRLDSTIDDNIICPICWKRFSLAFLSSELSEEHVAPLSTARLIGETTYKTLTCRNCNNTYGSEYHSQLKKFLIFQLHQNGKYDKPIKGQITMPNTDLIPLKSNISFTPNKVNIKVAGVPKANAPFVTQDHISAWNEMSERKETGWTFNVTFNYECIPSRAWAAFLQVAYLMAYIRTNCYYAFTKAGIEIRRILFEKKAGEIGPCIILPHKIGVGGKLWLARIDEPTNLRCWWVKVAGNIVILPFTSDSTMTCYQEWQRISEQRNFGLRPNKPYLRITFMSKEDLISS